IVFFKDSQQVIAGSDHVARMWDIEKGALVGRPFGTMRPHEHTDAVKSVAVSPDDGGIASGEDGAIIIWDVDSKQMVSKLPKHTRWVLSVCFSPDGKRFASG
ncbi:WD40-repeat-containing domain protein, partial [Suillus spraguei]